MKYPSINTTFLKQMDKQKAREWVRDFYTKHLQGKSIVNKQTGIKIYFESAGKGKLSHGGSMYPGKAAAVIILVELIEKAEVNNFNGPKNRDPQNLIGYINFKSKAIIDGKVQSFRITVRAYQDGKFYYNHEISIKMQKGSA